jgi:hypothetical protein
MLRANKPGFVSLVEQQIDPLALVVAGIATGSSGAHLIMFASSHLDRSQCVTAVHCACGAANLRDGGDDV